MTLSENPDGTRKGSVEFDIVAYGEDGTKLNVLRQTANVTLKPQNVADFQAKPFEVPLQLDLPPGKLFVRVGALDVLSGKAGALEIQSWYPSHSPCLRPPLTPDRGQFSLPIILVVFGVAVRACQNSSNAGGGPNGMRVGASSRALWNASAIFCLSDLR